MGQDSRPGFPQHGAMIACDFLTIEDGFFYLSFFVVVNVCYDISPFQQWPLCLFISHSKFTTSVIVLGKAGGSFSNCGASTSLIYYSL